MERYDPLKGPKAETWLALDEQVRLKMIEAYHRKARIRVPDMQLHVSFHDVVENQAALGEETPVRKALARLMGEGLDRHDAVHAVGATFVEHLRRLALGDFLENANEAYFAAVEKLTAASWRRDFG